MEIRPVLLVRFSAELEVMKPYVLSQLVLPSVMKPDNAEEVTYPASLTHCETVLVAKLEAVRPETVVEV